MNVKLVSVWAMEYMPMAEYVDAKYTCLNPRAVKTCKIWKSGGNLGSNVIYRRRINRRQTLHIKVGIPHVW